MKASSLGGPKPQFVDANGNPYSGAKLFFYAAGSSTKQNTYRDSTGVTPNTNPIVLDSSGRPTYEIWFTDGLTYKAVLAPSTDTDPPNSPIFTVDNLPGINDVTASVDEWQASGLTPTYVGATSFTVSGDQTATFTAGRRLKSSNTAGTIYSTVASSSYSGGTLLTTVTVVNDSGTLDSGLSSVSLSILRAAHSSVPWTTVSASGLVMLFADGAVTAPSIANVGDTNTGIWFPAADTLAASTNGTEGWRLNSSGHFLTGLTSSPTVGGVASGHAAAISATSTWIKAFQASTASNPQGIAIEYSGAAPNSTGSEFIYCVDNSAPRMTVRSNGGIANYQTNDTNLSDERLKEDFQPAPSYYDRWRAVEFYTFLLKDQTDSFRNLGVKAQQLETIAPELVDNTGFGETPEDGIPLKSVWQTDFQYATAKALQEAIEKLEALKAEFDAYKASHP